MTNLALFKPYRNQKSLTAQSPGNLFADVFDTFLNDDFFKNYPATQDMLLKPSLDIAETDKAWTVSIEIPGVEEKDINLEVENRTITVSGEKKRETMEQDENWHRVERSYGSFQRVLSLPEDVDENKIDASFKNGVLTLTLPRDAKANSNRKTIKIKKA